MSGSIFPYARNLMLVTTFRSSTAPLTCYVALCRILPPVGSTGSTIQEPSAAYAYTRVASAFNPTNWSMSDTDTLTNANVITFPTAATQPWGWVGAWALCTAATGGEIYAAGNLAAGRTVAVGDIASFAPGTLRLGLRG